MTLPGGMPALPGPYNLVANQPGPLSGGLGEFAALTEEQIKAWLEGTWRPHFLELGDPIEVLRSISTAVVSAFKGDFGPLIDLFGSAIKPFPGGEILVDLLDAFQGRYQGTDLVLSAIQSVAAGFRSLSLTSLPLGLLDRSVPNLIDAPTFDSEESIALGDGWSWDAAGGRGGGGAARFDAAGMRGLQLSNVIGTRSAGQQLDAHVWARWDGVPAGGELGAVWRWYLGETLVSETPVQMVTAAAAPGAWTRLSGTTTVPDGVDSVCLALVVEASAAPGTVWFDDASLTKPAQSLPQQWIGGLVDALGGLGEDIADALGWVKSLIESITGRARATLGEAFSDVVSWVGQLGTILGGGAVGAPLPSLVGAGIHTIRTMIEQIAAIASGDVTTPINGIVQAFKDGWAGLSGLTAGVETWIQDLINALLRAIRKVPVVGGTLADIIAEVGGLQDRAQGAQSTATSLQDAVAGVEGSDPAQAAARALNIGNLAHFGRLYSSGIDVNRSSRGVVPLNTVGVLRGGFTRSQNGLTVPATGWYLVHAEVEWSYEISGLASGRQAWIYSNGTSGQYPLTDTTISVGTWGRAGWSCVMVRLAHLDAGDELFLTAEGQSRTGSYVQGAWLEAAYLGPSEEPLGVMLPGEGMVGPPVEVVGEVPTYADLPADETVRARAYVVTENGGRLYVYGQNGWPADGDGITWQGWRVDNITLAPSGHELAFGMSDGRTITVAVPALSGAANSAAEALAFRNQALTSKEAAGLSETAVATMRGQVQTLRDEAADMVGSNLVDGSVTRAKLAPPLAGELDAKAQNDSVVHLAGAQQIGGAKTFTQPVAVPPATADGHAVRRGDVRELMHEFFVRSNYAIPHDTYRPVQFASVGVNDGAIMHTVGTTTTGSKFRLDKAGVWRIETGLRYTWSASGEERRIELSIDGMTYAASNTTCTEAAVSTARTMSLPAGTMVAVNAFQFTGGDLNLYSALRNSWITLTWLRP